ncbi:nuclear transport factor 2 family protein [Nodularia sp. UHCC 0506]|uniref:nuclear transport factor 2 family protein n=1 Tax=Nodularia sp. UHCC 0506 TaxID=3110243 RepID=UPI002B1E917C|nr:DUF4440 domain-containing protein [Nodularia sp. UHCC 0506]MEA5515811.1 DUF4440 domain-containing protein [Nodularia sp. UHCC 0506]
MFRDKDEIREIFEVVYPENVRTKNIEGYAEMYTENALWMPPNAPDRCGIPDIITGFMGQIANQDIDPIFTAEEIEVFNDFGYVNGLSVATIYPHDGSPSTETRFRALWVMKKECESWKIYRQIWNVKP